MSNGVPVTGEKSQGTTASFDQSETAIAVSNFGGKQVISVTFNDATDSYSTILYTPTTRKVLKGASLMGWSYSTDGGNSWDYGGRVTPPEGWAVLWGDPAITRSHINQRYVFMSNLAIPDEKYPENGMSGYMGSYIGGACIAKSSDGGVTFKPYQCVHNDHHFYDGGSMAAGKGGEIYAAFVDVNANKIDIWKSPGKDGQFVLMADPFPGFQIYSHPRLRTDTGSGALYVAAQRSNGQVLVNRHKNTWGAPRAASYEGAPIYPKLSLSDRDLRTGPQFSFDVGEVSQHGNDAIRFTYVRQDEKTGRYYLDGSFCRRLLDSDCHPATEWGTSSTNFSKLKGDQFNPVVKAFRGFISIPPVWKLSYQSRQDDPAGNTLTIRQGNLAVLPNGARILVPFKLVDSKPVCPDNRGYWGDYDDLQLAGFSDSGSPRFIRTFSDSSKGCVQRWEFTSHHLHVRSLVF